MSFRKISKDKYIVAAIITFLIFSLGLTLGFIIDDHRYNLIEEVNIEQDTNYRSVQLQYLYLDAFQSNNSCPILETALTSAVRDLSDSLSEVIAYEEEEKLEPSETRRQLVMRRYLLDNLRYWLLAQQATQRCDLEIVPILYFYAQDCPSCPTQGTILSYFKEIFQEKVLIFPINIDFRYTEPMVEIAMQQFGITKYPSLIIHNQRYEGVLKRDQLFDLICKSLPQDPACLELQG